MPVCCLTKTDADGRFLLCGLPMDQPLQIYAFKTSGPHAWFVVPPGGDADIEMILK
jgi:hypothetical protein